MDSISDWVWPKRWQTVAWWLCTAWVSVAGIYVALRVANATPLFAAEWLVVGSVLIVAGVMVKLDAVRRRAGS